MIRSDRGRPWLETARKIAVPAIVLALPLEFTGSLLPFRLDLSRLLVAAAAIVLALDLLLRHRRFYLPRSMSALLVAAFVLAGSLSWLLTRNPGSTGALAPLLLYPMLVLLVLNLVLEEADHRAVLLAFCASGVAVALVGVALRFSDTYLVNPDPSTLGRVNSTFFDPDILARFLALVMAAGTIAAGASFGRGWRAAALASALVAAAVLPITFSRIGFLLVLIVVGAVAWVVRPRNLALGAAVAILAASGLVVSLQPQVRDRLLNVVEVVEAVASPGRVPLSSAPGEAAPVASVKACGLAPGWTVVADPKALYGQAAELPAGMEPTSLAAFGQTVTLAQGRYLVWERVRVDDPSSTAGEIRQGVWDPGSQAFVPDVFREDSPASLGRGYRWLPLGTLQLRGTRSIQFRVQSIARTTTAWYVDQFLVTSADHPGLIKAGAPWGRAAALTAHLNHVNGEVRRVREAGAPNATAAALVQAALPGSSATFSFDQQPPAGRYQMWALVRADRPLAKTPELRASLRDSRSGQLIAPSDPEIRPSDACLSYEWRSLGTVDVPRGGPIQAVVDRLGDGTTDWHVDGVALVENRPGVTAGQVAGGRISPFRGPVNHLPLDTQRRYLIVGGLDMFADHPLAGVGYGGFQHNLVTRYQYDIVPPNLDTLSHNSFVTVLAEQGLIGFALLLAIVVAVVREVRRRMGWPARLRTYAIVPGVLLGLVVFDSLFEGRLVTEPYLWVLLGLLYSANRLGEGEQRADGRLSALVLTHYYPPEVGAPQGRLKELCERLMARGVDVTVVTCFPNYPNLRVAPADRRRLIAEERANGIRIIRTWVWAAGNDGFLPRVLNQVSFSVSSLLALGRCGPADVVFAESPPLTVGASCLVYAWVKGAPFIFNVSDIWPQSAVDLGALRNPLVIRVAEALERHLYRRAAIVSVVTKGILERLAERGVPREKLRVLTNGVDTSTYRPEPPDPALVRELGLEGRKVVLYAGTHGMAQGLTVILEAAKLVRDPSVVFLLIGDGVEKRQLVARAEAEGLENVRFLPTRPKAAMPAMLNLATATLIPLRRLELFRGALPSKMFESMATATPIVLAVWGEAADLVRDAGCGIVVEPEDPGAIAAAVDRLVADDALAADLGARGRRLALEQFDREVLTDRCLELLRLAAARTVRTPVEAPGSKTVS